MDASITSQINPVISHANSMAGEVTKNQIDTAKAHMAYRDAAWAARTEDDTLYPLGMAVPPLLGTETGPCKHLTHRDPDTQVGPSDYLVYQNSIASGVGGSISNIAEVSHGTAGRRTFMTWNWYAAYTSDHGRNWTGVNPYIGWPSGKGFCCDQDVLYDRGRNMWVWYRQGFEVLMERM